MKAIGFDATCIGNREWDLGSSEFANIVLPLPQTNRTTMRHYGPAFPFLSANLDFSADSTLNARYTSAIRNIGAFAPTRTRTTPASAPRRPTPSWRNRPSSNAAAKRSACSE